MKNLKTFTIQFVGLKQGEHLYDYKIDDAFFKNFDYDDYNSIDVTVDVKLIKKPTFLEFIFNAHGTINVDCDVTNEPYDQSIKGDYRLVVKFGHEYNEDLEDIIIIPYGEYEINIAQYIYELVVLAIPLKRVHPGVEDGTLESDMLDKLNELSITEDTPATQKDKEDIDPRWEKLKDFLTDK